MATGPQVRRGARGFSLAGRRVAEGGTDDHTHHSTFGLPADRGGLRASDQAAHPRAHGRAAASAGRPGGSPEPGWSPNGLYVVVGESLGNVSYHVRQLQKAGLIELVATKQRRGALEHYYTLA